MAKTDKKTEAATQGKSGGALNALDRLGVEPRVQRVLLLVALATVLAFIIVPKGGLTRTDYSAGDVVSRDIKASRDLLIPDEVLTAKKRDEAAAAVPALYDYDTTASASIMDRVRQLFLYLKEEQGPDKTVETLQASLETDLGVKLSGQEVETLLKLVDQPEHDVTISLLLNRAYRHKVVGNLKLFENDRLRGVVLRNLSDQQEAALSETDQVIGIGELQELVRKDLGNSDLTKGQKQILGKLVVEQLRPNLSYNRNETESRIQRARDNVQPVLIQVKKGEMIVREGDRVTQDQLKKLAAMQQDSLQGTFLRNAAGLLFCSFLILFIGHRFAQRDIRKYRPQYRDLVFLSATFIAQILLLKVGIFISAAMASAFPYVDQPGYYYILPFAVGAMLVRIVLNSEIALVYAVLSSTLAGFLFGNSFVMFVYAFLGSLAGAHWVRHVMERTSLFRAGVRLAMFNFLVIFSLHLMSGKPLDLQLIYKLSFGLAGGILAAVLVTGTVPLIESLFRYTTNIKLLELANMNNPVLRDLMIQAPGTYHHSIIVGNLAEAAAETINANPLMARVAAYYHDIGKVKKPLYFVENIGADENRHDKLAPSMSALVLMAHVKDGVEMARDSRLGQSLIDIIREHHGTSLMKFFYDKAKTMQKPGVQQIDERDYRYPGPKPQTREAALIMLADAVEAASRTLTDPTPARIQGMVQKIINNIFIDGQLDECELTLKDLHNIAKSFNRILAGIFHHRIDYPEPVSKEKSLTDRIVRKDSEDRDRKPAKPAEDKEGSPQKGSTEDLKRLGMS